MRKFVIYRPTGKSPEWGIREEGKGGIRFSPTLTDIIDEIPEAESVELRIDKANTEDLQS